MRTLLAFGSFAAALTLIAVSGTPRADAVGEPHYFRSAQCPLVELRPKASFIIPSARFISERLAERGVAGTPEHVWLDLSLRNNGFAAGTFVGFGPLTIDPEDAYSQDWPGLLAGATHYYRLNVRLATGDWATIGGGSFETPDCRNVLSIGCGDDAAPVIFAIPHTPAAAGRAPIGSWLDVSFSNNGFVPGTFFGLGPFDPAFVPYVPHGRTHNVDALPTSHTHYYRINVLYDDELWAQQTSGSFTTPDCSNIPLVPPGFI